MDVAGNERVSSIRKILVVTGTRAEYGLLKNVIRKIDEDPQLQLYLVVTGNHMSREYGHTIDEIIEDGFHINQQIDMMLSSDKASSLVKSMGIQLMQLADTLEREEPDMVLVLGDRYEILAVASATTVMNIPLVHISGGEITQGAIDEQIRHAITKMAHIHFADAEEYKQNIISMGEEPWRVFNVGTLGIENIKSVEFLNQQQLYDDLGMWIDEETLLVTYHPVTLEEERLVEQMDNLIGALSDCNKKIIITYPNIDCGGRYIIDRLVAFAENNQKVCLVKSLGMRRYLSVMKYCGAIVGNSSSALVEAPYLKKAVVNIGNRQKGRLMASNIISCSNMYQDIVASIEYALSGEFEEQLPQTISLYGEGDTSKQIVETLKTVELGENILIKRFERRS